MFKLAAAEEFDCIHCGKHKKSKNIATSVENANEKLCNGCYGELLSKKLIEKAA
jgi:NAD-dependent SIR2 family protein deacetylase